MSEFLRRASDDFGDLVSVSASAEIAPDGSGPLGRFDEWSFEFRSGTLHVVVDPDDDSIKLLATSGGWPHVVAVTEHEPWSALVGCHLRWGWTLTNQRGFTDGVQFEFARDGEFWVLQLVAEASLLTAYSLGHLDRLSNLF